MAYFFHYITLPTKKLEKIVFNSFLVKVVTLTTWK